jgi:hypothetical protein
VSDRLKEDVMTSSKSIRVQSSCCGIAHVIHLTCKQSWHQPAPVSTWHPCQPPHAKMCLKTRLLPRARHQPSSLSDSVTDRIVKFLVTTFTYTDLIPTRFGHLPNILTKDTKTSRISGRSRHPSIVSKHRLIPWFERWSQQ